MFRSTRYCVVALMLLCPLSVAPVRAGEIDPTPNVAWSVGGDDYCSFSSLQAAIDAAATTAGVQTLRIASNRSYAAQALLIDDGGGLVLQGGYTECRDTTPEAICISCWPVLNQ